jgi:hypothetical protein
MEDAVGATGAWPGRHTSSSIDLSTTPVVARNLVIDRRGRGLAAGQCAQGCGMRLHLFVGGSALHGRSWYCPAGGRGSRRAGTQSCCPLCSLASSPLLLLRLSRRTAPPSWCPFCSCVQPHSSPPPAAPPPPPPPPPPPGPAKKKDKILTMDPAEITYDMVGKKLREIMTSRGRKGIDKGEQVGLCVGREGGGGTGGAAGPRQEGPATGWLHSTHTSRTCLVSSASPCCCSLAL